MKHFAWVVACLVAACLLGSMGPAWAQADPDDAIAVPMPRWTRVAPEADRQPPPELLRIDYLTGEVTTIRPPAFDGDRPLSGAPGTAPGRRTAERGASDYVTVAADPRVVRITYTNPATGGRNACSGAVINRYVVLTASHCIANDRTTFTSVEITPAYDRLASSPSPYGRYTVRSATWYPQDFSGSNLTSSDFDYDIGFFVTNEPIGSATGWFGWSGQTIDQFYKTTTFRTQGYPAEVVGDGTRQMARNLVYDRAQPRSQQYCYSRIGYRGSSGSGIYAYDYVYSVRSNTGPGESCDVVIFNDIAYALFQAIDQTNPPTIVPESGWWWNAAQGGRGYAIEYNATTGNLFMGTFVYSSGAARTPVWYASNCSFSATTGACSTTLEQYANGQSLTSSYRPPTPLGSQGSIRIAFSDATSGTLTLPNGTAVPIVRFPFAGTSTPVAGDSGTPQTGWWWNAAQSGRGWFMEVQKSAAGRNTLYLVGYMYDADGQASWHVAAGAMISATQFEGTLTRHEGGAPISSTTGTSPTASSSLGTVIVAFTSTTSARVYLPGNESMVDLTRFKP